MEAPKMTMLDIVNAPKPLTLPAAEVADILESVPGFDRVPRSGVVRIESAPEDGGLLWYWHSR